MKDFFISYTGKDKDWAEWIAWQLEEAGYSTIIQAWDFRPGSNFVVNMHQALQETERMIAVFSEDYLKSVYCTPEWAAVFAQDPTGLSQKLVPVKVRECAPSGLLEAVVWISLLDLSEETARQTLLNGLQKDRAKPKHPPKFPGERSVIAKPTFPETETEPDIYIPRIRKPKTDLEISDFISSAFQSIKQYFSKASAELTKHHPTIQSRITPASDIKFVCEIFMDGQSKAKCKVWIDHSHTPQICYSESFYSIDDNSYNEAFSISKNPDELGLQCLMRFGWEHLMGHLDFSHLSPSQAAEYLWRRCTASLERQYS